jgi:DNA-directed RNA polymerase subunit RPC12/RpoP
MTADQLWATLVKAGIQLKASGEKLKFYPQSAVTAELLAQLRDHKLALLRRLREPHGPCSTCGSAIHSGLRDGQVICPGCTSADPTDVTEWLPGFADRITDPHRPDDQRDTRVIECSRCGSQRFRDVPIHNGRSVRSDCAQCGRFLAFPVWYGTMSDAPTGHSTPRRIGTSPGEIPTQLV